MTRQPSSDRAVALLGFIPALLSLVIVLHHPVLRQEDTRSAAALTAGIGRIAAANAWFHALILLLLSAQALGLYGLAERLGLSRLPVRAGVLLYGIATMLIFIPGICDRFVTPLLGARCTHDPSSCAGLTTSLWFEWAVIQAFTKVALATQALALLCWSSALGSGNGWRVWSGVAGALVATAPLIMLGTMTHSIDPTRLAEVIAFEAVWTMAAAAMLWRGMLVDPG